MIITHGSDPNQAALTFDDGPSYWTNDVIDVLARYHARATFFVLGKHIAADWILQRMQSYGHEIGSHGYSHTQFDKLTDEAILQELMYRRARLNAKFMRPPFGNDAERGDKIAGTIGMNTCMWSQLSGDWAAKTADEIVAKVNLDTDKGEIVLLHDGAPDTVNPDRSATVGALDIILKKYSTKKFITVSELTL